MSPATDVQTGWAFAPGHVTGIFSPELAARDPRGRGSIGAGLVLDAGVYASAEWQASRHATLQLHSDMARRLPISEDVARRLLARRPGALRITLHHELPIGQGFGMSAAGALATALAVARATGESEVKAREVAHLADLYGHGGLGGVSAILGGGLELREGPGIPPWGRVRHVPSQGTVLLIVAGRAMPSPALLTDSGFLERVQLAAAPGLARLRRHSSLRTFLEESEQFTDLLQLGPPTILRRVHQLRNPEARVAQAMFGRSLFAVTTGPLARKRLVQRLGRLSLRAVEVPIARSGARFLSRPT
jgi:pantoate kinase